MFPFRGVDYLEIDSLFSDEEKLVRQTVREFVDKEVLPHIEEWNREGKFPRHLVPLMAELGFYGANLEGNGCAGMSSDEYGLIMQEIQSGDRGPRSFVSVPGALGFTAKDIKGKWSLRASVTSSLSLEDARVPASNMLPNVKGMKGPLSCLTQARYGIGWGAIGAAMACYHEALEYAKIRKQFDDRPVASHQLVQATFADMITEITKAQLLALHVGRLKDRGRADFAHVSMLKRNNVKTALEAARAARDILGANGVADEYPIFRHMCNLESVYTYEGTHNIHTLIIGERVTGIPAYL